MDAAFLSAKRIGWKIVDPFHFQSDTGATIPLFDTSPKLVANLLKDGVQRHWQRKMASKLKARGWAGSRVCPDPIASLVNSNWAKQNPMQAHCACKNFTSGVWTLERASQAGYEVEDLSCQLCNKAPDTLQHRIVECPAVAHIRDKFPGTARRIQRNVSNDPFLNLQGILDHPADSLPQPLKEGGTTIEWNEDIPEACRSEDQLGGGWSFVDGSASRHPVRELCRASWAAIFEDKDGSHQASVSGPVWQHLPQTPQSAEYLGATAAIQLAHRPIHLVGDCFGGSQLVHPPEDREHS